MEKNILSQMPPLLLAWYKSNARILPWRKNPLPYYVWVSEIMLQQTRVEAVKPYFERFIKTAPDVYALAKLPQQQLFKLWEGLGYYSRVRNLQKAASIIVQQYGGIIPQDYTTLLSLPGIGPYTAGAIASIAYGEAVSAVDGNVLRVMARLLQDERDILSLRTKKDFQQRLQEVIPAGQAGDFTQSLMELGATVCVPGSTPKCQCCPLTNICLARQNGTAGTLPYKAPKKERKIVNKTVFVIVSSNGCALNRRPETGLLAGLWEFPNTDGFLSPQQAKQFLSQYDLQDVEIKSLPKAKHVFTHIQWNMQGYFCTVSTSKSCGHFNWASMQQLQSTFTLPSAFKTYQNILYNYFHIKG